jgi:hypothetical protein
MHCGRIGLILMQNSSRFKSSNSVDLCGETDAKERRMNADDTFAPAMTSSIRIPATIPSVFRRPCLSPK